MKQFNDEKLTITTVIINSADFLLTAKYLVQNLGLKIRHMTVERIGIRKLYLHAATDDKVHALSICLTNDHVAAKQCPVLLGAVAENYDTFLSNLERKSGTITLGRVGRIERVLRWNKLNKLEHYRPEVPLCLLSPYELNSESLRCYDEKAVLDWLLIPENDVYEDKSINNDSWIHWITMESRSLQFSIGYYNSLGFHAEDISDDWDEETHYVLTDTNIGIFLRNSQKSIDDSHVIFSVVSKNEIGFLPTSCNEKYSFATANHIPHADKESDLILTDINRCMWEIHSLD